MTGNDLMTVLITTGVREEKVRSKILEDLRTPTLDETVKLIEQMVYAKDTNARIEKRCEDSKVASINKFGFNKKPTKTLYKKDKEDRRFEKASSNGNKVAVKDTLKCNCCGQNRQWSIFTISPRM